MFKIIFIQTFFLKKKLNKNLAHKLRFNKKKNQLKKFFLNIFLMRINNSFLKFTFKDLKMFY